MTNKEASEWFKKRAQEAPMPGAREAFKLAAEALANADVPGKNVGDTISRQAALDIFDDYNVAVENGNIEAYIRDRKRLCALPSAQPEIIYCKDCARYDGKGHCERDVRDILGYGREWNEDDYCSDWIRRETDG